MVSAASAAWAPVTAFALLLLLSAASGPGSVNCHAAWARAHAHADSGDGGGGATALPDRREPVDPVARLAAALAAGRKRADLVIYNRVPKSGSTSVQRQVGRLARRWRYTTAHFVNPPVEGLCQGQLDCIHSATSTPSQQQLEAFAGFVNGLVKGSKHRRCLVDFHFAWVNFSQADQSAQPIYVNTVREPIERLLSAYHYARWGPRPLHLRKRFIRQYGNQSVDACLKLYRTCWCTNDCRTLPQLECTKEQCQDLFSGFNSQMLYFCPWGSANCQARDSSALQEAITVLHEYDAVGVLEHLSLSNTLFEDVVPSYFAGLSGLTEVKAKSHSQSRPVQGTGGKRQQLSHNKANAVREQRKMEEGWYSSSHEKQLRLSSDEQKTHAHADVQSNHQHSGGANNLGARRHQMQKPSEESMKALKELCSLDLAFYRAVVALLHGRAALARSSAERAQLEKMLQAKGIAASPVDSFVCLGCCWR